MDLDFVEINWPLHSHRLKAGMLQSSWERILRLLGDSQVLALGWPLGVGEHPTKAIMAPAAASAMANALAGGSSRV